MPSEAGKQALRDILFHIDPAAHFARDMDYRAFRADVRTTYAVTRSLEIISEASRRSSGSLKTRHPTIPWKPMAEAGNIYRHDYEDVSARFVWETLQAHLPSPRIVAEAELGLSD
jgi:uncharacterized protein with HEPN domain